MTTALPRLLLPVALAAALPAAAQDPLDIACQTSAACHVEGDYIDCREDSRAFAFFDLAGDASSDFGEKRRPAALLSDTGSYPMSVATPAPGGMMSLFTIYEDSTFVASVPGRLPNESGVHDIQVVHGTCGPR